jgi:hypothetical protein
LTPSETSGVRPRVAISAVIWPTFFAASWTRRERLLDAKAVLADYANQYPEVLLLSTQIAMARAAEIDKGCAFIRWLSDISSERHQMDAFVRRYIHENLCSRFEMLPDGAARTMWEAAIKNGDWEHGRPPLNQGK